MLGKSLQAEQFGTNRRFQFAVCTFELATQGGRRLCHQEPKFGARHCLKHPQQACQQQGGYEKCADHPGEQKGAELTGCAAQKKCAAAGALTTRQMRVQGM
jgi:hypothetical protein